MAYSIDKYTFLAKDGIIKSFVWNIPNILSISRILVTPVIVILLINESRLLSILVAFIFLAAFLTDVIDGYIARRMRLVTDIGKFLDPLADKLLIATALIMLIPLHRVPIWMVVIILSREIAVTGLRIIALNNNIVISADMLGKKKTSFQIAAIFTLLLHYRYFNIDFHSVGIFFLWIALIFTIISGINYFYKFLRFYIS
jgi:CDP-diacylglycerol--glycerol-3-phosphate 3-phosphatidyltransferase